MPVLLAVFTVVLGGCVIGLIILALAALFGNMRDLGKPKISKQESPVTTAARNHPRPRARRRVRRGS